MSLSTDMQKGNSNGCLTLQPNWSVSKLTSSSPPAQATLAAKKASATIPIVFAAASDPVGTGLVSSLARPGGNITGLSLMAPDLDGKRLELLKEAFPKVARVAFLWDRVVRGETCLSQRWRLRPRRWESNFNRLRCEALTILRAHLHERKGNGAQALITTTGALINTQQRQVLDFAAKNRLPAMYPTVSLLRPAA